MSRARELAEAWWGDNQDLVGENGYQILPSGLIIQWKTVLGLDSTSGANTQSPHEDTDHLHPFSEYNTGFPIPFPNRALFVVPIGGFFEDLPNSTGSEESENVVTVSYYSRSTVNYRIHRISGSNGNDSETINVSFLSIGY